MDLHLNRNAASGSIGANVDDINTPEININQGTLSTTGVKRITSTDTGCYWCKQGYNI